MSAHRHHRILTLGGIAAGTLALLVTAAPAHANTEVDEPDSFTSAFTSMATPDQVVDSEGMEAPGEPGATGEFTFRINSDLEIICYDITVNGITGDYESPAATATHVHEAAAGESGPPRLAFPNPEPVGDGPRTSSGCLQGPFTTGLTDDDDVDTGEGFSLAQIEADPAGFSADTHTENFVPGAVRGQLTEVPVGGLETGGGGTANNDSSALLPVIGVGALAAAGGAGFLAQRHRRLSHVRG
ncbi:CHRD domain-containing protein [Citricoccus sp.]|uniref:CHRD domain-containing protein n=1 Tax=Citricoccus sp. TaxID=1978372 RepID=UPI0028BE4BFB|nr:CHRD domain-containing protein [Citricoccus sp.]